MADFDPDKYLAESAKSSNEFDPDAYLAAAKKKSGNITIEIGKWYFRINGKAIRLRSPITFERD